VATLIATPFVTHWTAPKAFTRWAKTSIEASPFLRPQATIAASGAVRGQHRNVLIETLVEIGTPWAAHRAVPEALRRCA